MSVLCPVLAVFVVLLSVPASQTLLPYHLSTDTPKPNLILGPVCIAAMVPEVHSGGESGWLPSAW